MKNNLEHPINCETGELNRPVGMAEAGQEDSDEPEGLAGTAYSREFGRGFKAGRESAQKIARAEPSRGMPERHKITCLARRAFRMDDDSMCTCGRSRAVTGDTPPTEGAQSSLQGESSLDTASQSSPQKISQLKSGHVVLLEALRRGHLYFLQSNSLTVEDREILDSMWAAIKQAERT